MVQDIIGDPGKEKAGAEAPAFSPFHAHGLGPTPGALAPPLRPDATLRYRDSHLNHFE